MKDPHFQQNSSSQESSGSPRVDLSRIRHELRTPINHILGYSEMLVEEGSLPSSFQADLERIHSGGRELQGLIAHYFEEETFFQPRDLHHLYHELRTPVNHIIGYSELLIDQAEEQQLKAAVNDLCRIRDAATNWLGLMEAYLIETPDEASREPIDMAGSSFALLPGLGFHVPRPKSRAAGFTDSGAILVVDDDAANLEMLARRLRRCGYTVSTAKDGIQALRLARNQQFDLVLLDLIMPGLDGFQLLARFKSDPVLRELPILMLSALDEEDGIARCIEMGAEDYLAKPFNPVFLRARIGACLEKKRLHDKEQRAHAALVESERRLEAELAEAAEHVRSLLPPPLKEEIQVDWRFVPCARLGGDMLGYHWLDDDSFAVFVLDVCGHGLKAAFLSISVFNVLRSQTLPHTDFHDPSSVLAGLNAAFPMDRQNNMYFTIWYGVYQKAERALLFASGGHPPAILFSEHASQGQRLQTPSPIIGFDPQSQFSYQKIALSPGSRLYVFSDGAYELTRSDGSSWKLDDLVLQLQNASTNETLKLDEVLEWAHTVDSQPNFEDDLTIVELRF